MKLKQKLWGCGEDLERTVDFILGDLVLEHRKGYDSSTVVIVGLQLNLELKNGLVLLLA